MKFFKNFSITRMVLKSIKDYPSENKEDKEKYFYILSKNLQVGKKLADTLKQEIKFDYTPLGEIYTKIPENLDKKTLDYLNKFFFVTQDKIGSRGLGYYGLFGEAYKTIHRKDYFKEKNLKLTWESFWEEYDEYINGLEKLKSNNELLLLYLDNYRNFLLLWMYIFITFLMSQNNPHPIDNLHFNKVNEDLFKGLIIKLENTYQQVLDLLVNLSLNPNDNLSKLKIDSLPSIEKIYYNFKSILEEKIFTTKKKGKKNFYDYFYTPENTKIWFEKIFRNNREEDNLGIIFSIFLNKFLNESDIGNGKTLIKLINKVKQLPKDENEVVLSVMYGGIEFALVAKYLGYKSGFINYSVYHFGNKNSLINLNSITYLLNTNKDLKTTKNYIIDDNTMTGSTLEKLRTIFESNDANVSLLGVPRMLLTSDEIEILNKLAQSTKMKEIINKYEVPIPEIKKILALNVLYKLPRVNYKNRNINILIARKVNHLKKRYGKRFRSL